MLSDDVIQNINSPIVLGRTGLRVGRLVLAAGYGIGPEAIELALSHGQNLFYWGSLRRRRFGDELRHQLRIGRERLVIAVQSYSRSAWAMTRSVESALRRLGTDTIDLLILGFWQSPLPERIVGAALDLQRRGLVKFLCVSTHDLAHAAVLASHAWVDALMIRYNAANREAESMLAKLPVEGRPGIMAFTATRWGHLLDSRRMPAGESPLTATNCYRFCLAHPRVDAVICGPSNLQHWHEALHALEMGKPDTKEIERMKRIGDHVGARTSFFYNFGSRAG